MRVDTLGDAVTELALDAEELINRAVETTGLDDFGDLGDDDWRPALDRLVDSLVVEARLNDLGVIVAAGGIVETLEVRLGMVEYRRQHPEIIGVPVVPPVVIMGQGRTGTTILYDLLAQEPTTRVPLSWEVDRPLPPPETATYDTDPRIDEVEGIISGVDVLIPGFRAIHAMGAQLAQECVRITSGSFRSLVYSTQYRVPTYTDWLLDEADMAPAYRWHRHYLEHLQSRHPAPRWLVKSPAHIWSLGALLDEYPDALLVQTHRDPLRVISSLASLESHLRRIASDDVSLPEIAQEWCGWLIDGLDRSVTAREDGTVRPDQIIDIQFADFLSDPFTAVRAVYERLGLELTPTTEQRMGSFLAANPKGAGGGHSYTFSETGLDVDQVVERTARYRDYFGVASEPIS